MFAVAHACSVQHLCAFKQQRLLDRYENLNFKINHNRHKCANLRSHRRFSTERQYQSHHITKCALKHHLAEEQTSTWKFDFPTSSALVVAFFSIIFCLRSTRLAADGSCVCVCVCYFQSTDGAGKSDGVKQFLIEKSSGSCTSFARWKSFNHEIPTYELIALQLHPPNPWPIFIVIKCDIHFSKCE